MNPETAADLQAEANECIRVARDKLDGAILLLKHLNQNLDPIAAGQIQALANLATVAILEAEAQLNT